MKLTISETVDILLKVSLLIALGCSIYIFIQATLLKNTNYTTRLQSWQMPMIFALITDLFLLSK